MDSTLHEKHHHGAAPEPTPAPTLRDPVCGMAVSVNPEKHVQHDGHDYYFCSTGCRDKLRASPAARINGSFAPMPFPVP